MTADARVDHYFVPCYHNLERDLDDLGQVYCPPGKGYCPTDGCHRHRRMEYGCWGYCGKPRSAHPSAPAEPRDARGRTAEQIEDETIARLRAGLAPATGDPLGEIAASIASDVWDRPSIETREELVLALRAAFERLVSEIAESLERASGDWDAKAAARWLCARYGLIGKER